MAKIRSGFVSNSSSSSFLIYGTHIESSKQMMKMVKEYFAKEYQEAMKDTDEDDFYLSEFLYEHMKDLVVHDPGYDGSYYIGLSWDSVKDDETGKQFKTRIETKLKELFGEDIELDTYEEAWHD